MPHSIPPSPSPEVNVVAIIKPIKEATFRGLSGILAGDKELLKNGDSLEYNAV